MSTKKEQFITEISEEDFRRLDLVAYEMVSAENEDGTSRFCNWSKVRLNDVLDQGIRYCLEQGTEQDLADLSVPITIAIHYNNIPSPGDFYLDKWMNRFSGPRTYQIGFGIEHVYSTRDYFEAKMGDYWKVLKRETKALYRVHLDHKYVENFKLKHKTTRIPWSEAFNCDCDADWWLETRYDLDEENDKWVADSYSKVIIKKNRVSYVPVNEYGVEIKRK